MGTQHLSRQFRSGRTIPHAVRAGNRYPHIYYAPKPVIIRKSRKPATSSPGSGLPRGIILCGPKPATEKDIAIIKDFAAYLIAQKRDAAYLPLVCGHLTTREAARVYRCWRPSPGMYYCETCCKWKELAKIEKTEIPQEPLF